MKEKLQDEDKRLTDYLLGRLPEVEEIGIEERYVADAGLQAKLAQMEDELVDLYLGGQLSQEEEQRLEARFLSSPRGRHKLETVRSLIVVASQSARETQVPKAQRSPSLLTAWPARFALAGLALVLLLVLAWSIKNQVRHKNQIVTQPTPTAPTNAQREAEAPQTTTTASIVLEPITREVVLPAEVKIHSGADPLRIQLDLKGSRKSYTAKLLNDSGKIIWITHNLQFQSTTSGQTLVLMVPTNLFENGEYTILVSSAENSTMPIAEYSFVIQKVNDQKKKD